MDLDDDLCLCFHVSKRKILNYLRVEKPQRCGQLADCFGAGTGCGWCRPFLRQLFEAAVAEGCVIRDLPTPEQYRAQRAQYLRETGSATSAEGTSAEGGGVDALPDSPTGD